VQNGSVIEHNSTTSWASVFKQLGVPGFEHWPVPTPRLLLGNTGAPGQDLAAHKRVLQDLPAAIGRGQISEAALQSGVGNIMLEFGTIHAAFPELQAEWICLLAEGDMVGARGTLRGTHTGELWGFAPTGKTIAWDQFVYARIADGQVIACNHATDWTSALSQLGFFPH
jgi:predicted ester cyclase